MAGNVLTPMMRQYKQIKEEHKDKILFFRLGDFYEMFFDDALEASAILGITLTKRQGVPMCGIPYHSAKGYIKKLLFAGKKVAVAEQLEETQNNGITERKVVEIITPGTVNDGEYLEDSLNNFVACFCKVKDSASFAYIDISTGYFAATSWKYTENESHLAKELSRIRPRELLLPGSLQNESLLMQGISEKSSALLSFFPDWLFSIENSAKILNEQFHTVSLKGFGLKKNSSEIAAAGFLIDYLRKNTFSTLPHIREINVYRETDYLIIDPSSARNLELFMNLHDFTRTNTLLDLLDKAKTPMGHRLIYSWLSFPLIDISEIRKRACHIEFFVNEQSILTVVRKVLSGAYDIERLSSRIAMNRISPRELLRLKESLKTYLETKNIASDFFSEDEEAASKAVTLINNSITDEPNVNINEGEVIKSEYDAKLSHYREVRKDASILLKKYEDAERKTSGIQSLKVKRTNALGFYIEVNKARLAEVPETYTKTRELLNASRFTTRKLKEIESELSEAENTAIELEKKLYFDVVQKLAAFLPYFIKYSHELAYLDALTALSYTASLLGWVKAEIVEEPIFEAEEARHPVVEANLPIGEFVANSLSLSVDSSPSFALITGPNMAGKSTFLRQNALIQILSQIGSYVPAKRAVIGIADRVFCRVGASDNLSGGESTFYVEMLETANILRFATKRSLVIMDEVGRGTATEDGRAIAQSIAEELSQNVKCRTLFATHYHELSELTHLPILFLYMDVKEENGKLIFLRKIKAGSISSSYGINVAALAGVPVKVVERAKEILFQLQSENNTEISFENDEEKEEEQETEHAFLFPPEEVVCEEVRNVEEAELSPSRAKSLIKRWKKILSHA